MLLGEREEARIALGGLLLSCVRSHYEIRLGPSAPALRSSVQQ